MGRVESRNCSRGISESDRLPQEKTRMEFLLTAWLAEMPVPTSQPTCDA